MEKTEFRVLIKHCFLMGKNTVQAKQWIDKCYPDSCPSKATICRWFAEFKRGRTDTNDAERSGRPVEAVTPENVSEVTKIIMKDRKVKLREIAEMTQISYGSVFTILHEKLSMKKVFSKWVPRLLSMEQKQQQQQQRDFLRRYVTMYETWLHHYTPESKRQSSEWRTAGESRPKRPKTQQSAGKVMASVFWDTHGVIFIDYLEKGKSINSDYYIDLLVRLKEEIAKKTTAHAEKKNPFSPRQCTLPQVDENNGKIERIGL